MPCPHCGADHKRSKNGPCPKCYQAKYRKTEKGQKNVIKAANNWAKRHPAARERIVQRYREHTCYYTPSALHALRKANKRLEEALAAAEDSTGTGGAGERRGDDVFEWGD